MNCRSDRRSYSHTQHSQPHFKKDIIHFKRKTSSSHGFTHVTWLKVELLGCRSTCGSFPNICLQPDVFPEMEILWLLTRAWNTGILLYSLAQYTEAERWCGLAMSFLRHLGTLQESYERQVQHKGLRLFTAMTILCRYLGTPLSLCMCVQMSVLYGEVLNRLDKTKKSLMEMWSGAIQPLLPFWPHYTVAALRSVLLCWDVQSNILVQCTS